MRLEPNGFKCDMCGKYIPDMFECIKISASKSMRGANNSKVSSDIISKVLAVNHLCEKCYYTNLEGKLFEERKSHHE